MNKIEKKLVNKFMKLARLDHLKENFFQNSQVSISTQPTNDFSNFEEPLEYSMETVEIDVNEFARKLADAIADVFEETFGDKKVDAMSTGSVHQFVESSMIKILKESCKTSSKRKK